MLFSDLTFIYLFLPAVLLVYFVILRKTKSRNRFLLLASLFFYGWGEPVYVFLMLACILANYFFGRMVASPKISKPKLVLALMLIFNLGLLAIFKYSGFVIANLNEILGISLSVPAITLPIGISFFTFQGISYVIDVFRRQGEPLKNPLDVGLYIALFPQLIAGPIVRYQTIAQEINHRQENLSDFANGICLFIIGLGKKVLLANNFALLADKVFGTATGELSVVFAWLGAIAYALQIYFDFGGYSDMAIGLGKMFGFHFNLNFNYPYTARSVSDFWRRWHISLGSWFRDYVYFPLGGSRVKNKFLLLRNLLIVWFLTGLWHGANWTFIIWGLYYGLFIAIEKLTGLDKKLEKIPVFSSLLVMLIVIFGWVIFRAETLTYALDFIKVMLGLSGNGLIDNLGKFSLYEHQILLPIAIVCCLPLKNLALKVINRFKALQTKGVSICLQLGLLVGLAAIFITATAYLTKGGYNPFIYFNF